MKVTPLLISALLPGLAMGVKTHQQMTLAGESPVKRIVGLLQDMNKQLEADGKEDEKQYEKMECWCTETTKEKTTTINTATTRIGQLTTAIETGIAESARLGPEIAALKKEQAENDESMKEATKMREDQLKEYAKEKTDLKASITALTSAVAVMNKKATAAAEKKEEQKKLFLQTGQNPVSMALQESLGRHPTILNRVLESAQRRGLDIFLQGEQTAQGFDEIKGILSQMKENMAEDLKKLEEEEKKNAENHAKLVAAKKEEYAAGNAQSQAKAQQKAAVDEKLVNDKQDKDDTTKAQQADQKFLDDVKKQCDSADDDWKTRQQTRAEEMQAVAKAIEMLDGEDARKAFAKVFASFLQTGSTSTMKARVKRAKARMSALLSSAAARTNSAPLALLSMQLFSQTQLDGVAAVVKSVEDMVTQLRNEKAGETTKRTKCVQDIDSNAADQKKLAAEKEAITVAITDLNTKKKETTEEADAIKAEVTKMNTELAKAGEEREAQNKAFQKAVTDQRETQRLLTSTVNVLKAYYEKAEEKKAEGKFVQLDSDSDSDSDDADGAKPKPEGLRAYKKSGGGKGVLAMLDAVLADSKKAEATNIKSEGDAQTAYEKLVKDTNEVVKKKADELTAKATAVAAIDTQLADKKKAEGNKATELTDSQKAGATLQTSCSFLLKNYAARQTAFDDEISALTEAKGYLSSTTGASPKKEEKKEEAKK